MVGICCGILQGQRKGGQSKLKIQLHEYSEKCEGALTLLTVEASASSTASLLLFDKEKHDFNASFKERFKQKSMRGCNTPLHSQISSYHVFFLGMTTDSVDSATQLTRRED